MRGVVIFAFSHLTDLLKNNGHNLAFSAMTHLMLSWASLSFLLPSSEDPNDSKSGFLGSAAQTACLLV